MIRTEVVDVPTLRGNEPTLRAVYGFAWNVNAPDNVVPSVAVVRAEALYRDGRVGTFILRPGVWYGGPQLIDRVWLTSSSPGKMALDAGLEAGDVAIASDASNIQPWVESHQGPVSTADAQAGPLDFIFYKPSGARTFSSLYKLTALVDGGATRQWQVHFWDTLTASWQKVLGAFVAGGTVSAGGEWQRLARVGDTLTEVPALNPYLLKLDEVAASRYRLRYTATGAGVQLTNVEVIGRFGP